MPNLLNRLTTLAMFRLGFFSLRTLQFVSSLTGAAKKLDSLKEVYLILSVDVESDVFTHKTSIAGWEVGVPYILDILSDHGLDSKACWLIEFNIRDGLVFSNPACGRRFVTGHEDLVKEIKRRRHEFGLHPTVYARMGDRWDYKTPLKDPAFVSKVIHQGTSTLFSACKQKLVGCRTGNFHFAHSLAKALENEGYLVDSSCHKRILDSITTPNAWFAGENNYQVENAPESKTRILEIPTTDHVRSGWNGAFSLKYKPNMVKVNASSVIFLSAFFHNWDAVTKEGKQSPSFKEAFERFICLVSEENVKVVSFSEAYGIYKSLKRGP